MKWYLWIIVFLTLIVSISQVGTAGLSSNQVTVNFKVVDTDGNFLKDIIIVVNSVSNPESPKTKLTNSEGEVSFNLNRNEIFSYVVGTDSYKDETGTFITDTGKSFNIELEKVDDDQWHFYSVSNEDLEFRFDSLDDDTNYNPGEYAKKRFDLLNKRKKNIELLDGESLFQVVDSQTLNPLRAWGNFNPQGDKDLIDITLKENGVITTRLLEGELKVCGTNVIIVYEGSRFEVGDGHFCITEAGEDNRIPEWILKNEYRFNVKNVYEVGGQKKHLNFTSQEFFINNIDWKPKITSSPKKNLIANEEWTYKIKIEGSGEEFNKFKELLNYKLIDAPEGMSVGKGNGIVTWVPKKDGNYDVTVRVYHQYFENDPNKITFSDQKFTLKVTGEPNNPPEITSSPVTSADENENYEYQVTATDEDEDDLSYSLTNKPSWLSINSNTGLISGTAPEVNSDTGYDVTVKVSDGEDADTQSYTVNVNDIPPPNNAPVAQDSSTTTNFETAVTISLRATDSDGDALAFMIVSNPSNGAISNFDSSTGQLTYTPNNDFSGSDSFTFRANDGQADSNTATVSINVNQPVNNPPEITSSPVTQVDEGKSYSYQVTATDTDGDTLTFTLTEAPGFLSINSTTGLISGVAPVVDSDTGFSIKVKVSDGADTDSQSYTLTVNDVPEPNNPPVAQNQDIITNEDISVSIGLLATDSDNDALTYFITNKPKNGKISNFDNKTGELTYIPDNSFSGDDSFTFKVNDGLEDSNVATVSITVEPDDIIPPSNNPPVINSEPVTSVREDESYTYQINATDADVDTLTFTLTENPGWLSINSNTGLVSGTAPEVVSDTDFSVEIKVSDGKGGEATQSFILEVINTLESDSGKVVESETVRVIGQAYYEEFFQVSELKKSETTPKINYDNTTLKNTDTKGLYSNLNENEKALLVVIFIFLILNIIIGIALIKIISFKSL